MKILSREQIREADNYTIINEPVSSTELMERAAYKFTKAFISKFHPQSRVNIFCGKGNNGGDGLVIARYLSQMSYNVRVIVPEYSQQASEDFSVNFERLKSLEQLVLLHLTAHEGFPEISKDEFIIDALWGTGLNRKAEGFVRQLIENINCTGATIIAVDIASATFCDYYNTDEAKIKADYTFSFQLPKFAFFLPENYDYIGEWTILDIGLDRTFIDRADTSCHYFLLSDASPLLKQRNKFDHKGLFGHVMLMAGSYGRAGAAVLGARACLRSGAGLLTTYLPACAYEIMQSSVPEAMVITDQSNDHLSSVPDLEAYNVLAFGPGTGTSPQTNKMFKELLSTIKIPMVIDADGINMLSANKEMMKSIPVGSILTPHIGEFDRLAGKSLHHAERLKKAQELAREYQIIIVLKGAYTAVLSPDGSISFNSTGNAGMATAGSGDVLTGIISGLLAQRYPPKEAALLGVFVHGLSGDLAAGQLGQEALMAGDIIESLPKAFYTLQQK